MVTVTLKMCDLTEIVRFCWINFGNKWAVVKTERQDWPPLKSRSAEELRAMCIRNHETWSSDTTLCSGTFIFQNENDEMLFKLTWGGNE